MPYNFNKLYEGMLPFHNGFRQKLRMLEMATPGSQAAPKANVLNLVRVALGLCGHLEMRECYAQPSLIVYLSGHVG